MVFSRIVSWVAGLFSSKKNEELDRVIELAVEGFTKVNSRIESMFSELAGLKSELQASKTAQHGEMALVSSRLRSVEANATHVEEVKSLRQELASLTQRVSTLEGIGKPAPEKRVPEPSHNIVATENNIVTTEKAPVITPQAPVATAVATQPVKSARTVITRRNMSRVLPAALIPVFDELLNAEKFLSYAELAKRLGKKEATARAYVNELRTRGVAIDEETGPNGRKLVRLSKHVRREYMIPD